MTQSLSGRIQSGVREQRAASLGNIELRKADDGTGLQFRGRAAVFDEWTEIHDPFGGSFKERVQRGAFRKVLADGADVRLLINHDGLPLARTAARTMTLRESAKGLEVEADLADTSLSRDLSVLLERGDIDQMSFGFRVGKHELEQNDETGEVKRTITEFSDLFDVSPVTFPAYQGTSASVRACGVSLLDDGGQLDEDRLMDLAVKIFRGDQVATDEERAVIDSAFARTTVVSPWMAEQAARAVVQAPGLRAVLLERGVSMAVTGLVPEEPSVGASGMTAGAARCWLDVLAA